MSTAFETVFLRQGDCISEWEANALISCSGESEQGTELIVLPPLKPSKLKICIECYHNDTEFSPDELKELVSSARKGAEFWEELLYDVVSIHQYDGLFQLELQCGIWSTDKMVTLFEKPASLRAHWKLPRVVFLERLDLKCRFYRSDAGEALRIEDILPQFNEYFASLIVSQLEFKFPFVFSMINRRKFQQQSVDLGPLAYSLTNSSSLLPLLVKLIANDRTATTVYQLLNLPRRIEKKSVPKFKVLK